VRPSGTLVLSGVLDDAVLRAFPEWTLVDRHEEDGWLCFVLASPTAQAFSTQ
jgi:ribosomal protein L11 methylase PrmA